MGNAQSSPLSKEQRRLSKPKTNTNSPHSTPKPDSTVTANVHPQHHNTIEKNSHLDGLLDDGLGDLANNVRDRLTSLSRANSLIRRNVSTDSQLSNLAQSHNDHQSPLALESSQPIDVNGAIRLIQELQKNASPEDLRALRE
jgi:hypothetical protein